jgi:hypothetical protein
MNEIFIQEQKFYSYHSIEEIRVFLPLINGVSSLLLNKWNKHMSIIHIYHFHKKFYFLGIFIVSKHHFINVVTMLKVTLKTFSLFLSHFLIKIVPSHILYLACKLYQHISNLQITSICFLKCLASHIIIWPNMHNKQHIVIRITECIHLHKHKNPNCKRQLTFSSAI